jgi:hypothetical protein
VLVQGVVIPDADQLPAAIRDLTRRQAIELRHGRWQDDTNHLVDRIEVLLAESTRSKPLAIPTGKVSLQRKLGAFGANVTAKFGRFRRRVIRRSTTWKWVKRSIYVLLAFSALLVANAGYQYYITSDFRALQRMSGQLRYENPQESVLGAILTVRNIVVASSDAKVADVAVSMLKGLVLAKDDTTDKGRVIRKNALEMIKTLRRSNLNRDFGDGTLKGADLVAVDLSRTILKNVSLEDAFLIRTDFKAADLSGANLSGAWVRNADFAAATMTGANVEDLDWFNAKGICIITVA